jgi:5-methylcytosine-specific restriction enzyme subunit McrC
VGESGFTRTQANSLIAAARAHPLGGTEGTAVLCDHYRYLRAQQMVGVIAGDGCSLEVLPKVDPAAPKEDDRTVREQLVHMLDVALGLGLSPGEATAMAHRADSLLEVFIALFADMLLAEVRRGLPRLYSAREDDLPALRGRLDVVRQFTRNAVRPDRLACRFAELVADTPLMRVMKACVVRLSRLARREETRRKLVELRFMLAGVPDVPPGRLPWDTVRIDRASRRWRSLLELARLLLGARWQQTHADALGPRGITLLFPMNELFERYIAVQLRRALAGTGLEVVAQGGFRYCLGPWTDGEAVIGSSHPTRPDILIKRGDRVVAVLDTKWKHAAKGVSHADLYQMMAYAQLYHCNHLILLYPSPPGEVDGQVNPHGIPQTLHRLDVSSVSLRLDQNGVLSRLRSLLGDHVQELIA